MSRHIHLSLDIRGAIHNRDGWKSVSAKGGKKITKAEAVEWLMDRLAEGKRVLPFGPCEGFDFQKGCPGHEEGDASPPDIATASTQQNQAVGTTGSSKP